MKIIITAGDCNGIGIEILAKAWTDEAFDNVDFTLCCNRKTLAEYSDRMNIGIRFSGDSAIIGKQKFWFLDCDTVAPIHFGKITAESGALALEQLEHSIMALRDKRFDALVTMPVSKAALQLAGWKFPGQTEMLAARLGDGEPLMILASCNIRVALQTIHIPISDITAAITRESVRRKIELFHMALKHDFAIKNPRIAVLGLNPHAGEYGCIGGEEISIINPAIIDATSDGIEAYGPFPADGFFAFGDYLGYDGILAMYHDQGLIPLKLLAHGGGVNITAGLSATRVSPDHGTAFGIAGKGLADATSAKETLRAAIEIARVRKQNDL